MDFTHFTLKQDGAFAGSSAVLHQAVIAAARLAAETGKPVTVMAHVKGGGTRTAILNPDGTNEHIWNIDKGQPLTPTVRQVYINRGGGRYLCRALVTDHGTQYFNAAGGSSSTTAVFRNVKTGWTFTAKGVIQYMDGTIEWDHSVGGRFEDGDDEEEEKA